MAWSPITGTAFQFSNSANGLAVDYYLKMYDAGTTDPYSMATDSGGLTRLAKCKIGAEGYPVSNPADDTTVFVPHVDQNYRIVLYRNETDADNNTTANAAWNIDDLLPDSTIAADISQITTRGTTLQAQDDYDRSPLFVDVTDFTAGLGPHVITPPVQVPAWTPNDADFRFYKLSSAGAITTPTVTSSDATTFTISDTLLSSDTLFVGDEEFRDSGTLRAVNNLSELTDVDAARTNLSIGSLTNYYDNATGVNTGIAVGTLDGTGTYVVEGYPTASQARATRWSYTVFYNAEVLNSYGTALFSFNGGSSSGSRLQVDSGVVNIKAYASDAAAANYYINRIDKIS